MKLVPHLLKDAEYRRSIHSVILEHGTAYEDILKPAFWAHVARRLKPLNRIEVHPADGSWFAELLVRSVTHVSAVVVELRKVDLQKAPAGTEDADEFEIKFRGAAKWSAIRKSTKKVEVEGLESREEVEAWLRRPQAQAA